MLHTDRTKWLVLLGIGIAGFLGCTDLTIVNTALPAIQISLNASVIKLQWVMNIFLLALTAFMVISGKLSDLYGRRLYFYGGLILFALSSLGAGLAPTIDWLILARFIQGVGVAILYTVPVAMIPSIFPEQQQGRATGIFIGISGFGLAIGPVLGGVIVSLLGWRWIFLINLPIILISFILCLTRLQESKSQTIDKNIDWVGFILIVIALPAFIFATVQGSVWGWTSWMTIGLYVIAIAGMIGLFYVENKIKTPIIEFHLFTNQFFIIGIIANFSLAMFYSVDFFLMPLFLHYIHGQVGYELGLTLLPATAMVALLSPFVGRVVDKNGPKNLLMIGFSCFILSAIMQMEFNATINVYYILLTYILFGIGWACILSPSIVAALAPVAEDKKGVATGTLFTLHNFGGAIGLAVGTVIYKYMATSNLTQQLTTNNLPTGTWINHAIANTDQTVAIIQQNAQASVPMATKLFNIAFLHGYKGALILLTVVSLLALFSIVAGLSARTTEV